MKWSKVAPSEPGWWWVRHGRDTVIVQVEDAGGLYVTYCGNEMTYDLDRDFDGAEWSGPIPPPEEEA